MDYHCCLDLSHSQVLLLTRAFFGTKNISLNVKCCFTLSLSSSCLVILTSSALLLFSGKNSSSRTVHITSATNINHRSHRIHRDLGHSGVAGTEYFNDLSGFAISRKEDCLFGKKKKKVINVLSGYSLQKTLVENLERIPLLVV